MYCIMRKANQYKFITSLLLIGLMVILTSCTQEKILGSEITQKEATADILDEEITPNEETNTQKVSVEENEEKSLYKEMLENTTGKTVIRRISRDHHFNNPYVMISKNGTVIVMDPYEMHEDVTADIVTVSHWHYDHIDKEFLIRNTGKESKYTVETFTLNDVKVTGIASDHSDNEINSERANNVIYLFEIDGLRIAHLGDCGQDSFNEEQLESLGDIDVAFNIFLDFKDTNNTIEKSCKLIEQLDPKIVISHEYSSDGLQRISEVIGNYEEVDNELVLDREYIDSSEKKVVKINTPF